MWWLLRPIRRKQAEIALDIRPKRLQIIHRAYELIEFEVLRAARWQK